MRVDTNHCAPHLKGRPDYKLQLPVSQQQFIQTAVQLAAESAYQVVGLLEDKKTNIRELIMPLEENIKEILKELDEEVKQPVAEEARNAGEPNTANLHTVMEFF